VTNQLEDSELVEMTRQDASVAVAEFIDGLGGRVFAGGSELGTWAAPKVAEIVGIGYSIGGAVTTRSEAIYYLLHWDKDVEVLGPLRGPLTANELRSARSCTKGASA
jgi:hypothetical protein